MTESIINRNQSFYSQISKFAQRRWTVYNLIKTYNGLTSHEIKDKMVLGKHQISGRVTELAEEFWVKSNGSKLNEQTGKQNTIWVVTTLEEREKLVKEKLDELEDELGKLSIDSDYYDLCRTTQNLINDRIKKLDKLINALN